MSEELEKKIVQRLDRVIETMELLTSRMSDQSAVLQRLDRIERALVAPDLAATHDR